MSFANTPLHSWLRRVPVPMALRLDGKKTVIVGTNPKQRWKETIQTLEQLDPEQIEALDADGHVLRVYTVPSNGVAGEDGKEDGKPRAASTHRDVELANIILEATDRGARRHAEAYSLAFEKLTYLVQILAERLSGLENAWQSTLNARAEELINAGTNGDGDNAVMGAMLQLALAKKNAAPSTAKTNGKTNGKKAA